jgi:hypothetical protein
VDKVPGVGGAGASVEIVYSGPTDHDVVAVTAVYPIRPVVAVDFVVAAKGIQSVVGAKADYNVGVIGAGESIGLVSADRILLLGTSVNNLLSEVQRSAALSFRLCSLGCASSSRIG